MRPILFIYCLFFYVTSIVAQDSLSNNRIGFNSLFTVQQVADKDKSFVIEMHPKAISFVQSYIEKEGAGLRKMKTWAKPYFNLYDQILIANGIPVELKYLSVIESHLSAQVVSWAGAAGPWQIMPAEATRLGLKLLPNDERMDYQKSTQAAATILRELYQQFGDWLLVVAAYNGGAGRLSKVIEKKKTKDFWALQYELPLETRNHVKKFIATHAIFEGVLMPDGNKAIPVAQNTTLAPGMERMLISGRFNAKTMASWLKMPLPYLKELNPNMDEQLSTGKSYTLVLPTKEAKIFEAYKNQILQASIQSLYLDID
ncbi:MAG: lytic transglycosylase domain-containing protein [Sediminibacterium sp.]|nr:lytic transglycosylase domain-containing protein [Sediminibacterium sp.]